MYTGRDVFTGQRVSQAQAATTAILGAIVFVPPPLRAASAVGRIEANVVRAEVSIAAEGGVQFTKSSLKLGQEMHTGYKAGVADNINTFKEYNEIKGIRPDFVDFKTKTIYELKPNNPRAIREGMKQLDRYKSVFERDVGPGWKVILDTY